MMSIDVNGAKWSIEVVDPHDPTMYVDGVNCRGTCWHGTQQIFLSKELNHRTALRVVTHELTHAWIASTQMDVPDAFTEEMVCDFIAIYADDIITMAAKVTHDLWPEFLCDGMREPIDIPPFKVT